jgi:serine/threonine protein kinase/dipeptidyl aminopeptidase/acylaminoacyl peptidase
MTATGLSMGSGWYRDRTCSTKGADVMAAPKLISRRYEVLELLGQGGMGTVYKVRHTALGSISALKVLPKELMQDPEMVTRFYREARIMANLSHPSIVRVLDIDQDDTLDFHYFVMEYVEGKTLKQYVEQKGSLSLAETLDVVGQVARAVAYAHAHTPPIVHRDIKPANIMIEDRSGRVVVMDFGIAKELDGKELTRPGVTIGTLKYCAPEQMRQEQLDGAVDVYALGMVMYETYTGKHLFAGLGERELIARVLVEKSENAPVFEKPTPQVFADLVARAIAKSRDVRFPSMTAFLRELEACVAECATAPAHSGTTGRFRPRLVTSRDAGAKVTELKPEWRDEAATREKPSGPAPDLAQQVRAVRERTGVLRDATSSVKGRHRDRAERGWRRAEKLLDEGSLAEAKTSFEEAATLFSALTSRVADDDSGGTPPRRDIAAVADAGGAAALAASEPTPVHEATVIAAPPVAMPAPSAGPAQTASAPTRIDVAAVAATIEAPAVPVEPSMAQRQGFLDGDTARRATTVPGRSPLVPALIGAGVLAAAVALYLGTRDGAQQDVVPAAPPAPTAIAVVDAKPPTSVQPVVPAAAPVAPEAVAVAPADAPQVVVPRPGEGGEGESPKLAVVPPPMPTQAAEPVAAQVAAVSAAAVAAIPPEPAPAPAVANDEPAIIRFTRNPTVDVVVDVPGNATVSIDDRPVKIEKGKARASLAGLPVGESTHALRVASPDGTSRETPVRVTYYPAWEMRRVADLKGEAYAVAFGPDGTHLFAGTRSNVVKMYDAATGDLQQTFTGHKDWVNDVAVSPDGTLLASGSKDRTIKLWDIASGSELRTLEGHKGWVNGVAFSPDGSQLASGSDDQTVRLWDVATGTQLQTLTGHTDWILSVAFSPDGRTVASGARDKSVKLWDATTGTLSRTLTGHGDWVDAVAFSPDGKLLASASDDRRIKLWDVATGKNVKTLSGHGGWVVGVAFSPDGTKLISASKDQTVRLWDVATGEELRTFAGHKGLVGDVAFGPDGKSAVSGGRDRTLRLWWTADEPDGKAAGVEKGRDSG